MKSFANSRPALAGCAAAMMISLAACGGGSQSYRLVDLGVMNCSGTNCYVGKLNDWCEVAGWEFPTGGSASAVVWRPSATGGSTKTPLPAPTLIYDPCWDKFSTPQGPIWIPLTGPQSSAFQAYDINNAGEVAGYGSGPRNQAIVWSTRPNGVLLSTGLVRSRS